MSQQSRSTWDFQRFIETLVYFEIIPFGRCLQKIFTGNRKEQISNQDKGKNRMMILVIGAIDTLEKEIINRLQKANYQLGVLVKNPQEIQGIFAEDVEIITADLQNPVALENKLMNQVNAVIWSDKSNEQRELENLITHLKSGKKYQEKLLFDFTNPSLDVQETWGALDDVVMGGVSSSNFKVVGNVAVFSGNVSTDNNGGFTSVRSRNFTPSLDLAGYEGVEIRLKGDGKRYKFIARCEGKWDGIGYCYSFDTLYNIWQTIQIPFTDLIPVFRAKTMPNSGDFAANKIYSMQLMLSKFEYDGGLNPKFSPGLFALEVEFIKAYGGQNQPKLILISSEEFSPQENLVRDSGLNYTIINSQEIENEKLKIEEFLAF